MTPDMKNERTCLITGASRGIGAATAERMANLGYQVYVNYRSSKQEAEAVANRINEGAGSAFALQADVTNEESLKKMFSVIRERNGSLDVLVHNAAAPLEPKRLLDLDWDTDIQPHVDVSAKGFLNLLREGESLLQSGSRIVVVLTDALYHTPPVQMGAYLAAKGALLGLTRAAAKELRGRGIQVNSISPSMVETELLTNYHERALEIMAQDHPMKRLAAADEVASVIEAVATASGAYMNGANIIVNGGADF